jgi:hypothetical protein
MFHLNKQLLLLAVFCCSLAGMAQEKDKKEKDKAYVEKVNALFSTRPFVNQNIDLFTFNYPDSEESTLLYRPATGLNVGGEVAFKFLSFSYQKNLPLLQPGVPENFKADHQRIGFELGGKIFGLGIDYQQNSGFYVLNPSILPPDAIGSQFREDMNSKTFGTSLRFTFSNKLSANALFDQSERQLKSKGALTFIMSNRFHNFTADTAFIPPVFAGNYAESATTDRIWINSLQFMPGYGYIAVAGNWNIGLFLYSGTGLQIRKYFNETEEKLGLRVPYVAKGKGGISYNGKFIYAKLFAMADYTTVGMKDARIGWLQSSWEFSIGFRLYGKKDK